MPKVSIVLPTYNGEKYIRESIDSIINQTFTDWELIIVNDCSTDNTQKIIDSYVTADRRIHTIKNEVNQKLPSSLNIGFRKAKGEYLTWTSDDNIYLPEALNVMVSYLNKNPDSILVCTAMNVIDSDGNMVGKHCQYIYENMLYNDCVGASFMYRRCVLTDVGEYDASRFLVEDYDYWLRILFYYGKIDYIDQVVYLYRAHGESLTQKRQKEIHRQLLKLREFYIDNIIQGLWKNKRLMYQLYYDFKAEGKCQTAILGKFLTAIPEIGYEKEGIPSGRFIIYGAGNYGKEAYEKYESQVAFFADQNVEIVGKKIGSAIILSVEELKVMENRPSVMIAVSPANLYSCIETLK